MSEKSQPVIIIKKGGHGHHGHHGGAWKVAYADFVTAMMAFFLVMWIVGQSQEMKSAVAGYFRDPVAFEEAVGRGILPGADSGLTGGGLPVGTSDDPTLDAAEEALRRAADHLREALEETIGFSNLKDQVEIRVTDEGLLIELVEAPDDGFFDSGSAMPKMEALGVLEVIAAELAALGHPVAVEGHTDSRPFASTVGYTNWELSADRANAARRVLQAAGVDESLIEGIRGYAATRLRLPDQPFDASNRRVSIVVRRDTRPPGPAAAGPAGQPTPPEESAALEGTTPASASAAGPAAADIAAAPAPAAAGTH